ncbi:MAG TPA: hypothetical protein VM222_05835 [Planctomycetota bacterium]|nr:hypothetical protein [Planctomycetota bacterium]
MTIARTLAFLVLLLQTQELKLAQVPDGLPQSRKDALTEKRDELTSRWARHLQKKEDLRAEFKGITEDDPRVGVVRKRMAVIKKDGDAVVDEADAFNEKIRALVSHSQIDERIAKAKAELRGPDLTQVLQAELEATTKRIESTKAQIQKAGARLRGYPEAIEEWSAMNDKAVEEAHHAAAEAAATVVLEKLSVDNDALIEKDVDVLTRVAKSYRSILSARAAAPIVWDNLGRLERNKDLLELAKATKDALFATGQIHEGLDREKTLSVLLKTLGMLNSATVRDPRIGLLIADGELVIADVYLGAVKVVAHQRVNQILEVETSELKGLTSLTALYRADIDRRNRLRATLAAGK